MHWTGDAIGAPPVDGRGRVSQPGWLAQGARDTATLQVVALVRLRRGRHSTAPTAHVPRRPIEEGITGGVLGLFVSDPMTLLRDGDHQTGLTDHRVRVETPGDHLRRFHGLRWPQTQVNSLRLEQTARTVRTPSLLTALAHPRSTGYRSRPGRSHLPTTMAFLCWCYRHLARDRSRTPTCRRSRSCTL